jgi:phenylacetate-CoA ligase
MFQSEFEAMERKELERLQDQRLREIVTRVYKHVPFYKERLDARKISPDRFRGLADLQKLPFTTKKDLRDQYPAGLFAVKMDEVKRLHASSGTKGKPTVVGYTRQDLQVWADVCARAIVAAGGKPEDIFHNAYGYGLFTGGLGLHQGAERLGQTVIPASGGNRLRQLSMICDLKPRGIAGTPSFILSLGETLLEMGEDPRATSLEYGIFGAEPWSEAMREKLEALWGIHAVDIYGLSELTGPGVAIECWQAKDGLHVAEDHFLVEVIDPKTGEPKPDGEMGELVFTSLTKEAIPLIRYRTGDLASVTREPCRCGRTHARMSRVKGRLDDMLIIRGVNVFPAEIEPVIMKKSQLAPHYQLVIERRGRLDELTVEVEVTETVWHQLGRNSDHEQLKALTKELAAEIKDVLGLTLLVKIYSPKSIPRSEGKAVRIVDRRTPAC